MPQPKAITLAQNPQGILIEWEDGHKAAYPFVYLRKACPCALCKGERTPLDTNPLALPAFPNLPAGSLDPKDMFKVGRYALGFRWGDGHDAGIYTWDYLRKMCPCEECLK